MFYCFDLKKFLSKVGTYILILAAIIVGIRCFLLPHIFKREYSEVVSKYALEYSVDENLIYSVIFVESSFDEKAVSIKDAKGLMQITDRTGAWGAEQIGINDFAPEMLFNPEVNIHIGCWYISILSKQYDFEIDTVLAAYNAGSGNVSEWLCNDEYSSDSRTLDKIPFEETQKYVMKINTVKKFYDYLY